MSRSMPIGAREAARRLGVHENTVRNWEKRGILPVAVVLPSGIRRFSPEDIERMRHEMMTQFAPDTEMPAVRTVPTHRGHVVEGDLL